MREVYKNEASGMNSKFVDDKNLINFIGIYYLIGCINLVIKDIFGNFAIWSIASKGLLMFLLLLVVYTLYLKGNLVNFFVLEITAVILFMITLIAGNVTNQGFFQDSIFDTCVSCIPLAACFYFIDDKKLLLKKLYVFSWLNFIMLLFLFAKTILTGTVQYSMSLGYSILMTLLMIWDHYIEEKNKWDLLAVVIGIFVIFVGGSRGPLVCIVLFVALKFIYSDNIGKNKKILVLFLISVGLLLLLFGYEYIVIFIETVLKKMGINSRTLTMLLRGEFISHDSGRDVIQKITWEHITEKAILGWGLGGGWPSGTYPHNIVLEIILYFGLPLGILCIIISLILMYKGIRSTDCSIKRLAHIFVALSLQFLVSATFLWNYLFLACLAICISKNTNEKNLS